MPDQDEMDGLFAMARARRMEPSPDLMARILADAAAVQRRAVPVVAPLAVRRRGWLAGLAGVFGGFGGLAGVGGAAVAGLVLGFVQPAPVTQVADVLLGVQAVSVDLVPTTETWMTGE